MGLADRPRQFNYSWSGLSAWTVEAIDALGLDRFHLVVHDIGGPIGFDVVARIPQRVASLTALNTIVRVASFKRPWSMEPFARRGIGEIYLRSSSTPTPTTFARRWPSRRSRGYGASTSWRRTPRRRSPAMSAG
jgi:pimeloyl-ACP methyl ester carboxylesterase